MGKRKYRATKVKNVDFEALSQGLGGGRTVVSVDVAKQDMYAAVQDADQCVHVTVKWTHPIKSWSCIGLLEGLGQRGCEVEVPMEPSGT